MSPLAKKILVVDDDPAIRRLVAVILRREGFVVDTAADGLEAIDFLAQEDYAAILLDLMMPRVDGMGVLGYLRHSDIETLRSVIVLTAYAPDSVYAEPVWTILTKPFDVEVLVRETQLCIARSEEKREVA